MNGKTIDQQKAAIFRKAAERDERFTWIMDCSRRAPDTLIEIYDLGIVGRPEKIATVYSLRTKDILMTALARGCF